MHRVEMEVLTFSGRAINCYLACGFRQEPVGRVRREAGLYPDGWKRRDRDGSAASRARGSAGRSGQRGLGVGLGHGGIKFSNPIKTSSCAAPQRATLAASHFTAHFTAFTPDKSHQPSDR